VFEEKVTIKKKPLSFEVMVNDDSGVCCRILKNYDEGEEDQEENTKGKLIIRPKQGHFKQKSN
jgi:hypothetical protein